MSASPGTPSPDAPSPDSLTPDPPSPDASSPDPLTPDASSPDASPSARRFPGRPVPSAAHTLTRRFTLLAGVVCSLVAWFSGGTDGLVSAAMGTVLVVTFFWSGMIPLFVVRRDETRAGAGMGILLLTYTLRLALVLLALRFAERLGAVDTWWVGVTIVACALTWIVVHVATSVIGDRRRSGELEPDFAAGDTTQ